jgi:CDP-paratose 2-epimerase
MRPPLEPSRGNGKLLHLVDGSAAPVLITGGAGFIGANLAHRLLASGQPVRILDSLVRPGVERNVHWLRTQHTHGLELVVGDVRDGDVVARAMAGTHGVFHFAAQVAVTTSLVRPIDDFEVNARGTLNVLEAARGMAQPPAILFTSTNKVYGNLADVPLVARGARYEPEDELLRLRGIGEERVLDFCSPYGCSKGTADQYVLDYARTFGLDTAVLRMSCIYGPRQFGTEDQGWLAHFILKALERQPIVIYGDGLQVRDVLFVDDLVDAILAAAAHIRQLRGHAYNIGGGAANAVSLKEVIELIAAMDGRRPDVQEDQWRPGDQRYYVSDTRRFRSATGWTPRVGVREGLQRLYAWLVQARRGWTVEMAQTQPAQTARELV